MAQVFVVEDEAMIREMLRNILEGHHEVVAEVATRQDALELVPQLKEKGVDVTILDGSLSRQSDDDGEIIAAVLRDQTPGIRIVSCSVREQGWGDVNLSKPFSIQQLLAAVEG
tara:strand:+ start:320 stop:658 length:339 start_codon:yes stop_codon:yes gene_type:complete